MTTMLPKADRDDPENDHRMASNRWRRVPVVMWRGGRLLLPTSQKPTISENRTMALARWVSIHSRTLSRRSWATSGE